MEISLGNYLGLGLGLELNVVFPIPTVKSGLVHHIHITNSFVAMNQHQ